jgi:hypothetical protein
MIQQLWKLFIDWYRRDQIRISPSQGKFLHFGEGDRILAKGDLYQIVAKSTEHNELQIKIDYHLALDGQLDNIQAVLSVDWSDERLPPTVCLHSSDGSTELFDDDVVKLDRR